MNIRNFAMAAAALSLATAPAIAQADFARASAPIEGESQAGGSSVVLGILAAAAIVAGIIIAADGSDDEGVSG